MRAPEGGPARGSGPGSKVRGFISGPGFKVRGFVSGPGFKVRGFVSGRLRPIFPAPGPSWGRPHRSASMDSSKEDSGRTRAPALSRFFRLVVTWEFRVPSQDLLL